MKKGIIIAGLCLIAFFIVAYISDNSFGSSRAYFFAAQSLLLGALYGTWMFLKGLWIHLKTKRIEYPKHDLIPDNPDDLLEHMMRLYSGWHEIGAELAEDCFNTHLAQGKAVLLSQLIDLCHSMHGDQGNAVEYGLLQRLKIYTDSGQLETVTVEGDNVVIVHRDHIKRFLDSLESAA